MNGNFVEYDHLHLETSQFVYFMVQILSHESDSVYTANLPCHLKF